MTMIDFISIFYFILILFTFLISYSLPSLFLPSLFLFQSHEHLSLWVISYFTSRFLFEFHILNHHLPYLLRFSVLIFLSFMAKIHSSNSATMQHSYRMLAQASVPPLLDTLSFMFLVYLLLPIQWNPKLLFDLHMVGDSPEDTHDSLKLFVG